MTHALAIGYDWLFDVLSAGDRRTIRQAIVDKGLHEGEKVYRKGGWWAATEWNWNQVCNGGMTLGALAVAEDEPQLAAFIVQHAVASVPLALRSYAPDGAWAEGPGYWNYATSYTVYMLAGLESALGTDFGLSRAPGFRPGRRFRHLRRWAVRVRLQLRRLRRGKGAHPAAVLDGQQIRQPALRLVPARLRSGRLAPWICGGSTRGSEPANYPTDRWFRSADVVFLRSKWQDPHAVFVGFKAGDNQANHSHLDLGTFVFDAEVSAGSRPWGPTTTTCRAISAIRRWTYYRLGTRGQNTLLIDGRNQDPKAAAAIVAYHSSPERAHAVADLSAGYAAAARHVARGIALLDRRMVLVEDELQSVMGSRVAWQVHTKAEIELHGNRALLSQKGEKLTARILSRPTPNSASSR